MTHEYLFNCLIYCLLDPPRLPSVSVSPSAEIVEGSSVTLTCSSDANPAANYTWYKEDDESPKASGQNFTITDIQPEHSGSYYCVAQNSRGHQNSILQLDVVAGQCATQTCILFVCLLFSEISNNREYHQVESGGSDSSVQLPRCHLPPVWPYFRAATSLECPKAQGVQYSETWPR
uniref:Ig-like domain-containing protein n=1 Tax=Maylandia zebra TaxID=106582 RepID=A0A3P9CD63_9CICH